MSYKIKKDTLTIDDWSRLKVASVDALKGKKIESVYIEIIGRQKDKFLLTIETKELKYHFCIDQFFVGNPTPPILKWSYNAEKK